MTNREMFRRILDGLLIAIVILFIGILLSTVFTSCHTTRPHAAYVRPDGSRVGVSKQVVYLRPYQMAEAIHVAQDHAGITAIDSARHAMRVRAWGTCYLTTVVGR